MGEPHQDMQRIQSFLTRYLILNEQNYNILKETITNFYGLTPSAIDKALEEFDANHDEMNELIEKSGHPLNEYVDKYPFPC